MEDMYGIYYICDANNFGNCTLPSCLCGLYNLAYFVFRSGMTLFYLKATIKN